MTSARGWRRCPSRWQYCIRRTEFRRTNYAANWVNCRSRWKFYRRTSAALPATFTRSR